MLRSGLPLSSVPALTSQGVTKQARTQRAISPAQPSSRQLAPRVRHLGAPHAEVRGLRLQLQGALIVAMAFHRARAQQVLLHHQGRRPRQLLEPQRLMLWVRLLLLHHRLVPGQLRVGLGDRDALSRWSLNRPGSPCQRPARLPQLLQLQLLLTMHGCVLKALQFASVRH